MRYRVIEAVTVDQLEEQMNKVAAEGFRFQGALTAPHGGVVIMGLEEPTDKLIEKLVGDDD